MGIAVYPRLGELLQERRLTVADLGRRIEERFGLSVDPKTLYRLTHADPVQRADLEVAGATAAILGVGLDALFSIEATPIGEEVHDPTSSYLTPEQSQRLSELFDRQARGDLAADDQAELDRLVAAYGRRLHERQVRDYAARQGLSVEQARREIASRFEEAIAWQPAAEPDQARRRASNPPRPRRKRGAPAARE
jgi:transcriptional regulator with XRE-family HTH domain